MSVKKNCYIKTFLSYLRLTSLDLLYICCSSFFGTSLSLLDYFSTISMISMISKFFMPIECSNCMYSIRTFLANYSRFSMLMELLGSIAWLKDESLSSASFLEFAQQNLKKSIWIVVNFNYIIKPLNKSFLLLL